MRLSMVLRERLSRPTSVFGGRAAESLAEVAVGDGGGGALHLAQRRERRRHEHAGEQRTDEHDAESEAEEDREVHGEQPLGVLRRDRDDDRRVVAVLVGRS
jgi:hypothetical protein